MKIFKSEKGQSLVEAILALTIAVVIITAIVAAVNSGLRSAGSNKDQNLATGLAQEGIDSIRNFKSQEFAAFRNNFPTSTYCLEEATPSAIINNNCNAVSAGGTSALTYTRKVYVNHQGRDGRVIPSTIPCPVSPSTFIAVTVNWSDSKCVDTGLEGGCHKIELTSCLVDNNVLPAP
jgi:Tfp pilus assembly protein PilV